MQRSALCAALWAALTVFALVCSPSLILAQHPDPANFLRAAQDFAAEEKQSPATAENVAARFGMVLGLAQSMEASGVFPDLAKVFSHEDAGRIKELLAAGKRIEAAEYLSRCVQRLPEAAGKNPTFAAAQAAPPAPAAPVPEVDVSLDIGAPAATVASAVPDAASGALVKDFAAAFPSRIVEAKNGRISLRLTGEPAYVEAAPCRPSLVQGAGSAFGAHPAATRGEAAPFALAEELGIGWHRAPLAAWLEVQPDADLAAKIFNFERMDERLRGVPKNMAVLLTISLIRRLVQDASAQPGPGPMPMRKDGKWDVAGGEGAYVAFVKRLASRYSGAGGKAPPEGVAPVKYWQFENELDISRARSDAAGFAGLMRLTSKTLKAVDPKAFVLMGGDSGEDGGAGFERYYAPVIAKLAGKGMDAFDMHHFAPAGGWKSLGGRYARIRKSLDKAGFAKIPIWMTECGTYNGLPVGSPGLPFQDERVQAGELVKLFSYGLGLGIQKIFWAWGIKEGFHNREDRFDLTGLVYDGQGQNDPGAGVKKLGFYAYRRLVAMLGGAAVRAELLQLGAGAYGVVFHRDCGDLYVLWAG